MTAFVNTARVLLHNQRMILRAIVCMLLVACSQTPLELPDAGDAEACTPHAAVFCDATAALGCVAATESPDSSAALLPGDAAFPVGCTANIISDVRDTVTGLCKLGSVCTCVDDDAGDAAPTWSCTP